MNENTKQEIMTILELLRCCLIKNGVSMGLEFSNKEILFFDTDTYLNEKKFDGFSVNTDGLVN
jgi:hypothetical protein